MNRRVFFLIFSLVVIVSCSSSKSVFNPQTSKMDFMTFGTGGGFTGQVTKYYLTKNGTLYTQIGDITEKVGTISKSSCAQIYANYTLLGLDTLSLNEPGNKYYFIELSSKNVKNAIKWGKSPLENTNIDTYFKVLMNTVKEIKK